MDLDVRDISKHFLRGSDLFPNSKRRIQALQSVTFNLPEGESLGIVGESGSGKTTLAKILSGFINPDQGSAKFGEINLLRLKSLERARLIQMIFQDPFASLNPKLLLKNQLFEALQIRGRENLIGRAEKILADVGLPAESLSRYPHQLSGGQRQRFAIARALGAQPKILICDEPVSSLDISIQAQIINLLNTLRKDYLFTQVVISHDLAVIANMCDWTMVLKGGELVEQGPTSTILASPGHPYTQELLRSIPMV